MQDDRNFLVPAAGSVAGIVAGFHDHHAELPAVGAGLEVSSRVDMTVIPPCPGRLGSKGIPPAAVAWYVRCPFLVNAIYIRRNMESMPMDHFVDVGVVLHFHDHRLAFRDAQQRTGNLPVVSHRPHGTSRRQVQGNGSDAQLDIGLAVGNRGGSRAIRPSRAKCQSGEGQEFPASRLHVYAFRTRIAPLRERREQNREKPDCDRSPDRLLGFAIICQWISASPTTARRRTSRPRLAGFSLSPKRSAPSYFASSQT